MPPDKSRPTTIIRMGAAHYDVTVKEPSGQAVELDLSKARRWQKAEVATQLCAAYGITGSTPSHTKTKGKHHGKHQRRHKPTGPVSGEKAIREAAPSDGPKKRRRRRSAPGTLPASGHTGA